MLKNFNVKRIGQKDIKTLTFCNLNNIINKALSIVSACPCSERSSVLAVDDNIFNIVALQTVLEYELHLTSDKALNGLEALNKV